MQVRGRCSAGARCAHVFARTQQCAQAAGSERKACAHLITLMEQRAECSTHTSAAHPKLSLMAAEAAKAKSRRAGETTPFCDTGSHPHREKALLAMASALLKAAGSDRSAWPMGVE